MKQKIKLWLLLAGILVTAAACGRKEPALPSKEYENKQEEPDQSIGESIPEKTVEEEAFAGPAGLSEAPSMGILDQPENQIPPKSQSLQEISPESYNWNYYDEKGKMGLALRGTDLLSRAEWAKRIPAAEISLSWPVMPDGITVSQYPLEAAQNAEKEPEKEMTYEDKFLAEPEPEKIYVITAEWKRERLEENGFYGDASYVIVTE